MGRDQAAAPVPSPTPGNPVPSIELVAFPVEGMTCAACVNRITRYLSKVDGVEDAVVNLATDSATVRFDPARTDVAALAIAAVLAAGYVARTDLIEPDARSAIEEPSFSERHLVDLRRRLAIAAVLTIPLRADRPARWRGAN